MVASSLGLAEEDSIFARLDGVELGSGAHHALHEEFQASQEPLHPWAREMYRRGLSFNGNERSELYLGRGDGTFLDMTDLFGADSPLDGRALVAADFDDDGDLDLFGHNLQRERHELYRNDFDATGFLKIRLRADGPGWEAIGATVQVDGPRGTVAQVASRGAGFASCAPPELVFGLGEAEAAAVRVRWPGGTLEEFSELETGGRYVLTKGRGEAEKVGGRPTRLADPWPDGLQRSIGDVVPRLVVEDADGASVTLDPRELAAGGKLFLNFWARYCGPCLEELDELEALEQSPGQRVVAIGVDVPSERGRALQALQAAGTTFPAYFLALDEASNEGRLDELVDLLRLPIPTTIVIDGDGRIVEVLRGGLEKGD